MSVIEESKVELKERKSEGGNSLCHSGAAESGPKQQGRARSHGAGTGRTPYATGGEQAAGVGAATRARDRPKPIWHRQTQRPDRNPRCFRAEGWKGVDDVAHVADRPPCEDGG